MNPVRLIALLLIVARTATQWWLARLNRRHVTACSTSVPEAFRETITSEAYAKSVRYTLAKNRLEHLDLAWDFLLLWGTLFSGVLPWLFESASGAWGSSLAAQAALLLLVPVTMSLTRWPLEWHAQFGVEQEFGFNTTTPNLWWLDRAKGLTLGLVLGYPLLWSLLWLAQRAGNWWWVWAWGFVLAFETVLLVLAPVLILPLFNKFTPLPEGSLKERLLQLARATEFRARSIQVMDGSRRSRHSNAFFTGVGRFRKIVLFDTLIAQLSESELTAVLAHEIGHYRLRHIPKTMGLSIIGLLGGFYLLSWLAQSAWFHEAFGFQEGSKGVAFLLFMLLSGPVGFWITPLSSLVSRKFEYEADAFAAGAMRETHSLVGALRKLNEKNLSNLTPHPLYSGFYYSHPTLPEREAALDRVGRLAQ